MKPMICAGCGATLTMGIWESKSERVFCPSCIPPLAGRREMPSHSGEGDFRLRRSGGASGPPHKK